ncbi:SRPBCC domain-containing protein [Nonomuraea sp. NPDC050663]|uniref:SRPBCC domain-containing protein n=1 Tax=Nonomuraea sp. NPDC050663 TaxID=3364370 RepID=UPI0037903907
MAFPDRIERSVVLASPPEQVWAALTTSEGLSSWLGENVTIDLRPGGAAQLTVSSGRIVDMRIARVEEPTVFGFTWRLPDLPEGDPRRTYVEFTLEASGSDTRLRVVETGFAQLPDGFRSKTHESHIEGWASKLDVLADRLAAA